MIQDLTWIVIGSLVLGGIVNLVFMFIPATVFVTRQPNGMLEARYGGDTFYFSSDAALVMWAKTKKIEVIEECTTRKLNYDDE